MESCFANKHKSALLLPGKKPRKGDNSSEQKDSFAVKSWLFTQLKRQSVGNHRAFCSGKMVWNPKLV